MNIPHFSHEYADLQRQFHRDRPDYGVSGSRYADQILELSQRMKSRDILDYGCGKATLQKALPFPIQNYDPFIEEYCAWPVPSDIVVCTDVMEHVEMEHIMDVLANIRDLTKKIVFFQVATREAKKVLPDGRNAHITLEQPRWWIEQMLPFFNILQFNDLNGGFIAICSPFHEEVKC